MWDQVWAKEQSTIALQKYNTCAGHIRIFKFLVVTVQKVKTSDINVNTLTQYI